MKWSIDVKEGHIVVTLEDTLHEYNVALDRCRTYEEILGWVLQISEKNWATSTMLREFVRVALTAHGLKYPAV